VTDLLLLTLTCFLAATCSVSLVILVRTRRELVRARSTIASLCREVADLSTLMEKASKP
jgi:hypothetical protein